MSWKDYKQLVDNLLSKTASLEEKLKVYKKSLYGCKSQKKIRNTKQKDTDGHEHDKDNYADTT